MIIAIILFLLTACSGGLTREQRKVRRAAERCYTYLQQGQYAEFVNEISYADSMSDEYRAEMVDVIAEFAAIEEQRHGGYINVEAIGDTIIGHQAHVYLQLQYADSTTEEIGLPMVKVGRKWKMQ